MNSIHLLVRSVRNRRVVYTFYIVSFAARTRNGNLCVHNSNIPCSRCFLFGIFYNTFFRTLPNKNRTRRQRPPCISSKFKVGNAGVLLILNGYIFRIVEKMRFRKDFRLLVFISIISVSFFHKCWIIYQYQSFQCVHQFDEWSHSRNPTQSIHAQSL